MTTRKENAQSIINVLKETLSIHDLRPSQADVLNQYISEPNGHETGLFDLATGFGKTRIMTVLSMSYLDKNPNGQIVIAVPNIDLIDQIATCMQDYNKMFSHEKLDIGFYYYKSKDTQNQIIITTYNSLEDLKEKINVDDVGLLLLDEAHHATSEKRSDVVKSFKNAAIYGMSGTPWYSPDKNVENLLGTTIAQVSVPMSIKEGDLADCKNILMVSDFKVDLSKLQKIDSDYDVEKYYQTIYEATSGRLSSSVQVDDWKKVHTHIASEVAKFYQSYTDEDTGLLNGKTCIINCRSQKEARVQAHELNKLFGRKIAEVWTSDTKDQTVLDRFKAGKFPVICQVGRLGEGFDMPELDMCINYPACSRVLEAQRSGRPIRKPTDPSKNKMALIVDIAFMNPNGDNIIESIHQNGQVLYQDILETPVLRKDLTNDGKSNNEDRLAATSLKTTILNNSSKTPVFHSTSFQIISKTEDLITLANEAKKRRNPVQNRRNGMLTSHMLVDIYSISTDRALNILRELSVGNITFKDEKGKDLPIVEMVKSGKHETFALNEHPNAKKRFEELYPDLKEKAMDENMLSCPILSERYNVKRQRIKMMLESFFKSVKDENGNEILDENGNKVLKSETFKDKNGNEIPIVEQVRAFGQSAIVLQNHPEAIKALEERFSDLKIQRISDRAIPLKAFAEKYHLKVEKMKKILQSLFDKEEKFTDENGNQLPLVKQVKASGNITLVLDESPLATQKFEQLNPDILIPLVREGMITAIDLQNQYDISQTTLLKNLKELYDKNACFTDDKGNNIPAVEKVRNGAHVSYALHEDPKALLIFEQQISRFNIKKVRPGMLTAAKLCERYNISDETVRKKMLELYDSQASFTDENGNNIPIIEKVKNRSKETLALHESPHALKEFITYCQKDGKILKERPSAEVLKKLTSGGNGM